MFGPAVRMVCVALLSAVLTTACSASPDAEAQADEIQTQDQQVEAGDDDSDLVVADTKMSDTIEDEFEDITVSVPESSIDGPATLEVSFVGREEFSDTDVVVEVVDVTLTGGDLTGPATISRNVPEGVTDAWLIHENEANEWDLVPASYNPATKRVFATVEHFSLVGWVLKSSKKIIKRGLKMIPGAIGKEIAKKLDLLPCGDLFDPCPVGDPEGWQDDVPHENPPRTTKLPRTRPTPRAPPQRAAQPPVPSGPKRIALSRGASAPHGYWYSVTLSGFPRGARVTVACHDSVDRSFWTQTFTTNGSGKASDSTLCYSADGPDHWITGGGVESNHVRW